MLQKWFLHECGKRGLLALPVQMRNRTGFPDVMVLHGRGRVTLVELKREKGRLSVVQRVLLTELLKFVDVVVLYGYDQCSEWLNKQGERK